VEEFAARAFLYPQTQVQSRQTETEVWPLNCTQASNITAEMVQ